MNFRFVQYGSNTYPDGIIPELIEIAGHLDKDHIEDYPNYSLHTEYSYGKRSFSSGLINMYPELCSANKDGVPQLWKNNNWSFQFANFLCSLTNGHPAPMVVEVHPPFSDYCNIDLFLEYYTVFEKHIHEVYPSAEIVIENRAGSLYHGGKFIISKSIEIATLCHKIQENDIRLGVVLDFPQLLTAEHIKTDDFDYTKYSAAIDTLYAYQSIIKGIHIWGKKKNGSGRWIAHNGTLDTYFTNPSDKEFFIEGIKRICSDGRSRFFVPEVNSGESDLKAVVTDIIKQK